MNNTAKINKKSLYKLNSLRLPDYSARYKRLRKIAKSTGRELTADLWELEGEMIVEDLMYAQS